MLIQLILCATTDVDYYANCFSPYSSIDGDSQQMTLTLILQPNPTANNNCLNSNNTIATAVITFAKPIGAYGYTFNTSFTYYSGTVNRAVVDLKQLGFDTAAFMEMTQIQNAIYEVALTQLSVIKGTINQITHIKQDVSSCWSKINFLYGIMPDDEYFGFEFVPNMCYIPDDVLDDIQMFLRVTDMTAEKYVLYELYFGENAYQGGFKLPYSHEETLKPVQYCADYEDQDTIQNCKNFIKLAITTIEWESNVVLAYTYMDISTEIIGVVDSYELFESNKCSEAANLAAVTYVTRTLISHLSFSGISECNQYMAVTDHVEAMCQLASDTDNFVIRKSYSVYYYFNDRNFALDNDNSVLFGQTTYLFAQFIFYDTNNKIVGGHSLFMYDYRSCIRRAVMRIATDKISLEIWMEGNPNCKGIHEYNWQIDLIDANYATFYSFPPVFYKLNRELAINTLILKCSETPDQAECKKYLAVARKLSKKQGMTFQMQSTLRYIGSTVYQDDVVLGLVFPIVLMVVYFIGGVIFAVVMLRNKHRKDDI